MEEQIRMAVSDDASSIASVLYESFGEYKSSYTPEGFTATILTSDQIRSRMNEGPVWVALHNDAIVGTVSAIPKGEALYIRSMAALPAARGQGIGALLLRHIEKFASAHGYKRLFLSTTPFLTRAIRLYEHFGFRRSGEGPHDLFGTPLFTMAKTLEYSEPPIACDLTALSSEQRLRRDLLANQLKRAVQDIRELPDGYAIRFATDESTWMVAAEFVTLERQCCPFLTFSLEAESERGPIWLRLAGREGVKEFLWTEFGFWKLAS